MTTSLTLTTKSATAPSHEAIELFAGGGSVHLALAEAGINTVFANDFCPHKRATYAANHPGVFLDPRSIVDICGHHLPAAALLHGSSPCTDYSTNGERKGNLGEESVLAHHVVRIVLEMAALGRAPKVVTFENVMGMLYTNKGEDCASLFQSMVSRGYRVGPVVIDAVDFVPQARKRIFLVCVRGDLPLPKGLTSSRPNRAWHPAPLVKAYGKLSSEVRRSWVWWRLPLPPARTSTLEHLMEADHQGMKWRSDEWVERMLSLMKPAHRERLEKARQAGVRVGVVKQRLRGKGEEQARWYEVQLNGHANCLLTGEGNEMQRLVILDDEAPQGVRVRDFTSRERARLTGLPDDYLLPGIVRSRQLTGDAVVVPVYSHLAQHLLRPLVELEPLPVPPVATPRVQPRMPTRRRKAVGADGRVATLKGGIKGNTVGMSLYLLPEAHRRVLAKAQAAGIGLSDYFFRLLDRDCAASGEPPLPRYAPAPRRMPTSRLRRGRGGRSRTQVEGISVLRSIIIPKRPMRGSRMQSRPSPLSAASCCPSRDPSRLSATLAGNLGCLSASSLGPQVPAPLLSRLLGERPPAWAAC